MGFLVLLLAWIIFNGRCTADVLVVGAVISALLTAARAMLTKPGEDGARTPRQPLLALRWLLLLLRNIFLANCKVIVCILSKRELQPAFVRLKTPLRRPGTQLAMAQGITLTPGTLTLNMEGGCYLVHGLDARFLAGLEEDALGQLLCVMEGKECVCHVTYLGDEPLRVFSGGAAGSDPAVDGPTEENSRPHAGP